MTAAAPCAVRCTEERRIIARCRRAISALRHEPVLDADVVAQAAMLKRGPHDDGTLALYREFAGNELARRFTPSGRAVRFRNAFIGAFSDDEDRLRTWLERA